MKCSACGHFIPRGVRVDDEGRCAACHAAKREPRAGDIAPARTTSAKPKKTAPRKKAARRAKRGSRK